MNSVLGCGTRFVGHIDRQEDNSYLTTGWFCLFYIPIIPQKSYRVTKTGDSVTDSGYIRDSTAEYMILEELPPNLFQVFFTWFGLILIPLTLVIFVIAVLSGVDIDNSVFVQAATIAGFFSSPVFTATYAHRARRKVVPWFLAGLVVPWVMPLILVLLKSRLPKSG